MKILFLSSWYPNRKQPRLGNFIQRHAEAVAAHSQVASLFVMSDEDCQQTFELELQMIQNVLTVNVYYKKIKYLLPVIARVHKAIRYTRAHFMGLREIKKQLGDIDIIHQNVLLPSGAIALLFKYIYGIPYLVTEHSTEYHLPAPNGFLRLWLKKRIASDASFITPVSENLGQAMLKQGLKGNYKVINNVVNTSVFYPSAGKIRNQKFKFLHISTLNDSQKNISGLLRVVKVLSDKRTDFELHLVGDEDYKNHLKLAEHLKILNRTVFFHGTMSLDEVANMMRSSDCFVMFSNYENFPCVIAEAMSCGLPIISTEVGGISEHLSASNGMLVKQGDEPALLSSFTEMLLENKKYDAGVISKYADRKSTRLNSSHRT